MLSAALAAGACADDGVGPSARCADVVDPAGSPLGFEAGDVQPISLGDSRSARLSATDPENEGRFFHVWAFALGGPDSVRIDAESDEVDTALLLFGPDWDLAAADDDRGDGTNARIDAALTDGCWIVVVTSFEPGETGSYLLSLE